MSEAQKILRMIEAIDLNDTLKLDEIDELVHKYLAVGGSGDLRPGVEYRVIYTCSGIAPRFTRSRDALKAIRPEGWHFDIYSEPDHANSKAYNIAYVALEKKPRIKSSDKMPTEELAELHAIIQAIEFERGKA